MLITGCRRPVFCLSFLSHDGGLASIFSLRNNQKDIIYGFVTPFIISFWGCNLNRQIVVIPMGTSQLCSCCCRFVLLCCEKDFTFLFLTITRLILLRRLTLLQDGYIDDLLNIDNPYF